MGSTTKSIIYITNNYNIENCYYIINDKEPFSKILLREAMYTGKNIILNKLTPEFKQIIRYNNGYLQYKYIIIK